MNGAKACSIGADGEERATTRTAALIRAIERVADALMTRGIYP